MGHTGPDFSGYVSKQTVYGLSDLGELAARLGSIVTFDRRGDVVYLEDFSHGLAPYLAAAGGTGGSVAISALRSKTGCYSCKLTAGSDGSRFAQLTKYLPYPIKSNIGFETSFTLGDNTDVLQFWIRLYNGVEYSAAFLQINVADSKLEYENETGGKIALLTGFAPLRLDYMFHTVKMVVDFVNNRWVRIMLDELTFDMAGISLYILPDATASHLVTTVCLLPVAGNNPVSYLDNFIITQNEP